MIDSCENIYEVLFPIGKLSKIGYQSFKDCTQLRRLVLPPSLYEVSDEAFLNCKKLKCGCVDVPEDVIPKLKDKLSPEILEDYCRERDCYVSFDRFTCKTERNVFNIAYVFILLGQ